MSEYAETQVVFPDNVLPMFEANELLGQRDQLSARMKIDGYLFFRDIIPRQTLHELREQITHILAELGWIRGGAERDSAKVVGLPQREGEVGYFDALDHIVKLEALHSLAHEKHLTEVIHQVLGESAFPHPLSIVRLVFPNHPEITTPPHQDYRNNQGTVNLTASWIPLGNCSMESGALAILEGSNRAGLLPLQYHLGPGNRGAILSEDLLRLRWVSTDFHLGDILLFPAFTVHSALHNSNRNSMRLSVDFRYQLEGEALTEACLKPHFNRVSWEEIYRGWKSEEFKYYWMKKNYLVVPWDNGMHRLPEEHLRQAIRQGKAFDKARMERHAANPLRPDGCKGSHI